LIFTSLLAPEDQKIAACGSSYRVSPHQIDLVLLRYPHDKTIFSHQFGGPVVGGVERWVEDAER
jgi:hypothetical protein